ncbi:hypothetical protein GLUCOINTEAF2_0204231 [Komagataeibacter intermedius AF2]|uniref:Uncharacterized protein n=1 Tax=Komagataeibacter intermedius AF2 TaxID=1458464 RepID=A0A0N1N3M9_9PROT|nr:hypothetical protein GLUCOINTEAF2_0204231 [Komagataeibacter intermedius AF2]
MIQRVIIRHRHGHDPATPGPTRPVELHRQHEIPGLDRPRDAPHHPQRTVLYPQLPVIAQEVDTLPVREHPLALGGRHQHVVTQLTRVPPDLPRRLVQRPHIDTPVRQHDLAVLWRGLTGFIPPGHHPGPRLFQRVMPAHQAGRLIALQRPIRPPGRKLLRGHLLPAFTLPAHGRDFHRPDPLGHRPERTAGLDRLQLLGITYQHHLGPNTARGRQHPLHLP